MTMIQFSGAGLLAPRKEGDQLFEVRLIDRRTGEVPRVNGKPLSFLTHAPRHAAAELLRGRNRALWRTHVEPVEPPRRDGRGPGDGRPG